MTARRPEPGGRQRRRRATRIGAATAGALAFTLVASAAHAADTLPWTGDSAAGANQPYQHGYSPDDLLRWDPSQDRYAEMLRAQVPLQERNAADPATQMNPDLPADTQLLSLAGDYGNAFFESHQGTNEFSQHLFSFWQYSDYYASWHGMPTEGVPTEYYDPEAEWTQRWFEFGALNLPNPAYTNAAHANGVKSLACIFFSANDRGHQNYKEILVRDADGSFPAVAKLVEIADYYGFDGYFMNQEDSAGVDPADIPVYKEFLQELRDAGQYIQWYDSTDATTGELRYLNEFEPTGSPFVEDPELGRITDSMFLNYWWNNDKLTASKEHAEELGLDPKEAVFAGLEAGMYQFEQPYDLDANLGPDGTPMNSIATLGTDFVSSDYENKTDDDFQWEVFDRERRWWTGSSTGGTTQDEGTWKGMSTYIAERSAISGTTFSTDFNTGHGLGTWVDGELSNDAEWGDINRQDIPVTWQWRLDTDSTTPLSVDYDYGPDYVSAERFDYTPVGAHDGGSSLVLNGALDADTTLRLFQTDLDVVSGSFAEVTYSKATTDDSELRLAVVLASDPDTVVQLPIAGSGDATDGWTTSTVDLGALAGESISTLGLTVGAGETAIADYQVNVGGLTVTDGVEATPAAPIGLAVTDFLVDTNELYTSWDIAPYDAVKRYELYLDDALLGAGYDSVRYDKALPASSGTLRLVAVGHDGSRSAAAELELDGTTAPSGITAEQDDAGAHTATSTPPPSAARATTVTLESLPRDPVAETVTVPAGETSATIDGMPLDGSEYRLTIQVGSGTPATVRAFFDDREIEPYPASSVELDGTSLVITPPELKDWHTLTIREDGEPIPFATTYSQGERPEIIRGRTTRPALTVTLSSATSGLTAELKDYAGNTVTTVLREGETEAVEAAITLASSELAAGDEQNVAGTGFAPDEAVTVTLESAESAESANAAALLAATEVASATTDADGAFATAFAVPADAEPGTYTVTAATASGTAEATFVVVADGAGGGGDGDGSGGGDGDGSGGPGDGAGGGSTGDGATDGSTGDLAATGTQVGLAGLAALLLLAAGTAVMFLRRRAQRS